MALVSGTKLGPYEVLSPAGAGGMGEVYRARDTRLDRTVAIKVLPDQYSGSPELIQRFEREARAISGLNHPNICHLYDIGHQDGIDYLVLEYIEGETLADRLKKGPLPLETLLSIGVEIAAALSAAHRQGIVHRDLKPGNVMLTSSGAKLLDFGLAKPVGLATAAGSSSAPLLSAAVTMSSPSPHSPLTGQGTIIGTIQYMSPEQIEGKEADARSDIFAFGAMLYELATGQRAFTGKSQISVASSILEKDPEPISRVLPATPSALDRIVRTCLAKNPEERFQCAGDLRLELEWLQQLPAEAAAQPSHPGPGRKATIAWALAASLGLLVVALGVIYLRTPRGPAYSTHSYILPPEKSGFVLTENHSGPPVISPDGSRLAFTARNSAGQLMLWVQPLNSPTAQALSGTEEAYYPFWSPDGRYIGFFGPNKLFKIDANGGPPQPLCDAPNGRGGAWNAEGTIVFSANATGPLLRVNASGGAPTPLDTLATNEDSHRWPQFLPDGKHLIYFAHSNVSGESGIFLAALDSKDRKRLLRTDSNAIYAEPGYLLFVRDNALMAQGFSPGKLEAVGDARPIAAYVAVNTDTWRGILTASHTGILLFQHGSAAAGSQLLWFDRDGKQGDAVMPETLAYHDPAFSRDGKKLALAIENNGLADIWVIDLDRKTKTRITFGPEYSAYPLWSPDGQSLIFGCGPSGRFNICRKAADGTGNAEKLLATPDGQEVPYSLSPDGRYVAFMKASPNTKASWDIWALPLFGDRKPFPVVATAFTDAAPAISPDGRWIAYNNNESGRMEVYLQPFPSGSGRWQVSTGGGDSPQWRRDGKELSFRGGDRTMMVVDVNGAGSSPQLGAPRSLFKLRTVPPQIGPYAMFPDGSKFLVNTIGIQSTTEPLTLVTNWTADLEK